MNHLRKVIVNYLDIIGLMYINVEILQFGSLAMYE